MNSEEVHQEKRGHISAKTEANLCKRASLGKESSDKKTKLNLELELTDQKPKKQQRRKREKYLPQAVPLVLPPCRICGKVASGIHYGVNSCEACKGFFRRYLKRKEPFHCTKGGHCVIDQSLAGSMCPGCRLQKCFSLGMSKEGIRQGRYTLQERTNAIIEMKKRQTERCSTESREYNCNHYLENEMQSSPFDHPSLSSSDMQSDSVSSFSCSQNSSLTSTSSISPPSSTSSPSSISSSLGSSVIKSNKPDPQILKNIKSEYSKIPSELGSSTNEIQQHISCNDSSSSTSTSEKHSQNSTVSQPLFPLTTENIAQDSEDQSSMLSTIEKLMDGYKELKPFTKNLSDEEIQALLSDGFQKYSQKVNLFGSMDPLPANVYNEIFNITNMDIDGRMKIFDLIRQELVTVIHEYVRFTHGIPAFQNLPSKDQASLLKAARLEFFLLLGYRSLDPETGMMVSYTGHVLPIRQFCAYAPGDMSTSWLEVTRHIRHLQLHPKEHAAMLGICLTFTDRCPLEDPKSVEKIQTCLLGVLQNMLRVRYQGASGRHLARIMDVFIKLRGLNEEFLMVYKKICQDRFIIQHLPELLQFLFDE